MQQNDQLRFLPPGQQVGQNGIIQVGDRLYQIAEISAQPIQTVQSSPYPIVSSDHPPLDWGMVATLGLLSMLVAGGGVFLIVKAALPPTSVVAAPPPAPAPVIINQPPPVPQPYTETNCKPGGFLGMGKVCTTRQGYR